MILKISKKIIKKNKKNKKKIFRQASYGVIWRHMTPYDAIWRHMTRHLPPYGAI